MCSDSTWTKLFLLSSVSFYTTYIFVSGEGFWEVEGWEGKIGQGNTWREKRGRQAILLGIMPLSIIRLKKRGPNTCYCKFGCYCKIVIAKLAKATLEERREVDKLFWDIMPLSKIRLRKKGDNTCYCQSCLTSGIQLRGQLPKPCRHPISEWDSTPTSASS